MSKLLLLALVVALVWWLSKGFRGKSGRGRAPERAPEQMVRCSHCGLYLPQDEAVREGERYFCSAEHRRLAG